MPIDPLLPYPQLSRFCAVCVVTLPTEENAASGGLMAQRVPGVTPGS